MTTREVLLDGGSPWGFRMHGGADSGLPLKISRVNPGSKAAQRGVREGDVITTINSQSAKSITNSDAHGLLRNAGETLLLGLNEDNASGSPKRRTQRSQPEASSSGLHSEVSQLSDPTATRAPATNGQREKGKPQSRDTASASHNSARQTSNSVMDNKGVAGHGKVVGNERNLSDKKTTNEKALKDKTSTNQQSRNIFSPIPNQRSAEVLSPTSSQRSEDVLSPTASERSSDVLSPTNSKRCRARRARKQKLSQRKRLDSQEPDTEEAKDLTEVDDVISVEGHRNEDAVSARNDSREGIGLSEIKEARIVEEIVDEHVVVEDSIETIVIDIAEEPVVTQIVKKSIDSRFQGEPVVSAIFEEPIVIEVTRDPTSLESVGGTVVSEIVNKPVVVKLEDLVISNVVEKPPYKEESVSDQDVSEAVNESVVVKLENTVYEEVATEKVVTADQIDIVMKGGEKSFSEPVSARKDEPVVQASEKPNVTQAVEKPKVATVLKKTVVLSVEKPVVQVVENTVALQDVGAQIVAQAQEKTVVVLSMEKPVVQVVENTVAVQDVATQIVAQTQEKPVVVLSVEKPTVQAVENSVEVQDVDVQVVAQAVEKPVVLQIVNKLVTVQVMETPIVIKVVENNLEVPEKPVLVEIVKTAEQKSVDIAVPSRQKPTKPEPLDVSKLESVLSKNKNKHQNEKINTFVKGLDSKITVLKNTCSSEESHVTHKTETITEIVVHNSKDLTEEKSNSPIKKNIAPEGSVGSTIAYEIDNVLENKKCHAPSLTPVTSTIEALDKESNLNVDTTKENPKALEQDCSLPHCNEQLTSISDTAETVKPSQDNPDEKRLTAEERLLLDPDPAMSNEEEVTLRHFLHRLNISDSHENDAQYQRRTSEETLSNDQEIRQMKRQQSEDFYVPHQRYLEVILEENSDIIDNDKKGFFYQAEKRKDVTQEVFVKDDHGGRMRVRGWEEAVFDSVTGNIKLIPGVDDSSSDWAHRFEDFKDRQSEELRTWVRNCRPLSEGVAIHMKSPENLDRVIPRDRDSTRDRKWEKAVFIMETEETAECSSGEEVMTGKMSVGQDAEFVYIDSCSSSSSVDGRNSNQERNTQVVDAKATEKVNVCGDGKVLDDDDGHIKHVSETVDMSELDEIADMGIFSVVRNRDGVKSKQEYNDNTRETSGTTKDRLLQIGKMIKSFGETENVQPEVDGSKMDLQAGKKVFKQISNDRGDGVGYTDKLACETRPSDMDHGSRFVGKTDKETSNQKENMEDTFNEFAALVTSGLTGTMERFSRSIQEEMERKVPSKLDKEFRDYVLGVGEYSVFSDDRVHPQEGVKVPAPQMEISKTEVVFKLETVPTQPVATSKCPSQEVPETVPEPEVHHHRHEISSPESVLQVPDAFSRQQSSSSDTTSANTIVYNSPANSDIETSQPVSISAPPVQIRNTPNSLKLLCISKMIAIPFGICVLQQVGFLSKDFQNPSTETITKTPIKKIPPEKPKRNGSFRNTIAHHTVVTAPEANTHINNVKVTDQISKHDETSYHLQNNKNVVTSLKDYPCERLIDYPSDESRNADCDSTPKTSSKLELEQCRPRNGSPFRCVSSTLATSQSCTPRHSLTKASSQDHPLNSERFSMSPSRTTLATTGADAWLGTPTKLDAQLLVCLSPAQRRSYHGGDVPTPEDADRLLDLHKKFTERRGHKENDNKKQFQSTNQYDFVPIHGDDDTGYFTTRKSFIEKRNSLPNDWAMASPTQFNNDDSGMNQAQYESLLTYTHYNENNCDPSDKIIDENSDNDSKNEHIEFLEEQIDILSRNNNLIEEQLRNHSSSKLDPGNHDDAFNATTSPPAITPSCCPTPTVTSPPGIKIPAASERDGSVAALEREENSDGGGGGGVLAMIQQHAGEVHQNPLNKQNKLQSVSCSATRTPPTDTREVKEDNVDDMNRRPATLSYHGDVVRGSPSWGFQDGDECRTKVNILADWLNETRGIDMPAVGKEAVIDEEEMKKDFKETFSYWTQRERGIFENVEYVKDVDYKAPRNQRFSLSDSVRQDMKQQLQQKQQQPQPQEKPQKQPQQQRNEPQDVTSEFLKRSQAILKEERMNLSTQKRYSLPQEQFEKQLNLVQQNDQQQQQQLLADKKISPPRLSAAKPDVQPKPKQTPPPNHVKQRPPEDLQQQLKQTIEHRRLSYQEQENQSTTRQFDAKDYKISKRGDIAINDDNVELKKASGRPKSMSESTSTSAPKDGDRFRQQMYNEYMNQVAERVERRRQKVLKISAIPNAESNSFQSDKPPSLDVLERKSSITRLENEFINRAKERMDKLGIKDEDDEDGGYERRMEEDLVSCSEISEDSQFFESCVEDYVIEGDVRMTELPRHLQEYLALTSAVDGDWEEDGVWTPGQQNSTPQQQSGLPTSPNSVAQTVSKFEYQKPRECELNGGDAAAAGAGAASRPPEEPIPVVWTPRSAGASPQLERKEFRPVNFESPTLPRKKYNAAPKPEECFSPEPLPPATPPAPPLPSWAHKPAAPRDLREDTPFGPPFHAPSSVASSSRVTSERHVTSERRVTSSDATEQQRRLTSSKSAPASGGLYSLASSGVSLPRVQSPTITLLQKAREGQLPRGALYLDHKTPSARDEEQRNHAAGRSDYESDGEQRRKGEPRPKIEGIGPITKDGMPIVLRSEVKDENHAKWYKRMYDSLHRAGKDDEYVTVRYKQRGRGKYPYSSAGGYLSEPEQQHGGYDSDYNRYATLDRRRIKNKENDYTSSLPRSRYAPHPDAIKYATDVYRNQPGRIENYQPGHSSIADKETKQWWDEVLDIFDGAAADQQQHKQQQQQQQQHQQQRYAQNQSAGKSFMSHALKESGYESDSTLVFKRRDDNQSALSPVEHKMAYKSIQKGGEAPLHGFRKLAPERPKESPHRYVESEVTIHYRSPVRAEAKEALSEEELARVQAEAMRRIYQEERRRKYLQELQDTNNRRHTDNFTPSQKSPIPLNRYDDFFDDVPPVRSKSRERTPEPKLVARAMYNFQGQTSRELSFRRGDIIFVRKQIDKNWYEGEHNAMIGLFPFNYVEIIPYDGIRTMPRKPTEGQARAKFNFIAQTHLELSLVKGEVVVLTRRVDDNWYEGRISTRKGIFPVSYVDVLCEPGERPATPITLSTAKPIASPAAHSLIVNGQQQALTQHHYVPPEASMNYYNQNKRTAYAPVSQTSSSKILAPVNQTLHIDTHSDPIPYRALYNYRPQNEDELELKENDTVFVMEKCDDGWYVGSSHRTGYFGTFPGNYVERI